MFKYFILGSVLFAFISPLTHGDTVTTATLSGVKCRYSNSSGKLHIKCSTSDGKNSCEESASISRAGISMTRSMLRADCYSSLANQVGKVETIAPRNTSTSVNSKKKNSLIGKSDAFIQSYKYCMKKSTEDSIKAKKECLEYGQFREEQLANEKKQFEKFKKAYYQCRKNNNSFTDDQCRSFAYNESKKKVTSDCSNLSGRDRGECDGSIWVRKDENKLSEAIENSSRGSLKKQPRSSLGEKDQFGSGSFEK